jgi:hypothetical protein
MVCHTLTHAVSLCVCVLSCQWEVDSADVVGAEKERVWRSVSAWINQSIISICLITSLPLNGMKEGAATVARGVLFMHSRQRGLLPLQLLQPAAL